MNEALVVILAFLWALLLLPGAIRSWRSDGRAAGGFPRAGEAPRDADQHTLPAAAGWAPVAVGNEDGERPALRAVPAAGGGDDDQDVGYDPVIARRRQVFLALVAGLVVMVVLGAVVGGAAWLAPLVGGALLAAYGYLLRRWKLQRDEARAIVRELRGARRPAHERPVEQGGGQRAVGDELWAASAESAVEPADGTAGGSRQDG